MFKGKNVQNTSRGKDALPETDYSVRDSTILAKNYGQLRKTVLSMTPQAMYKQFKRHSAGTVSELYHIYRKT